MEYIMQHICTSLTMLVASIKFELRFQFDKLTFRVMEFEEKIFKMRHIDMLNY